MGYKPYAKYHLYETAHSGFYDGELSAKPVNLLPKTWTKFTVTDGDWKTNKTLEPLCNRDIFLANEIDKVDEDKKKHYVASSHFIIDHENETMYVNPFDSLYTFTDGIIYEPESYSITTKFPDKDGGVINKLYLDGGSANYKFTKPNIQYSAWCDSSCSSKPIFSAETIINGSTDIETEYNTYMRDAGMIVVVSGGLLYDDDVKKGYWRDSLIDCWSAEANARYVGPSAGWNYKVEHPEMYENTAYSDGTKNWSYTSSHFDEYFNPLDRTPYSEDIQQAGPNLISGVVDMVPENALYIW